MVYNFYLKRAEGSPAPLLASNDPLVVSTIIDALVALLEQVRREVNAADSEARWLRIVEQLEEESQG